MRHATILLLLVLATAAQAMMLAVPLETTTSRAAEIVRGEIISQKSEWSYDYRTIQTEVVVRIDESLKGSLKAGQTVSIVVEGGVVGTTRQWVEHQPSFRESEEVLLFLREVSGGAYAVQSVEQGKYTVSGEVAYDFQGRQIELNELKQSIRYAIGRDQR